MELLERIRGIIAISLNRTRRAMTMVPSRALILGLPVVASALIVASFCHGFDTGINALVAVGTLATALVAVFHDWVRAQIMRPNFSLSVAAPSLTETRNQKGERTADAWYFGLNVRNESPWPATNCRVLLKALHRLGGNGEPAPEPMTIPCPFGWSVLVEDRVALTINSGKSERVNFLKLVRPLNGAAPMALQPVLAAYTFNFNRELRGGETAWYFIQIDADNLASEYCRGFRVHWDGEWPSRDEADAGTHVCIAEVAEGAGFP